MQCLQLHSTNIIAKPSSYAAGISLNTNAPKNKSVKVFCALSFNYYQLGLYYYLLLNKQMFVIEAQISL